MWRDDRAEFERLGTELAQRTLAHANSAPRAYKVSASGDAASTSQQRQRTTAQTQQQLQQQQQSPKPEPSDKPSTNNFVFVIGSLIAVFVGVFVFFKFFKSLQVPPAV